VILDANFGLVYPAPEGGWQYTCDDIFVGRIPYRTQIAPDGRVFVPTMGGLWSGSDPCSFQESLGDLRGQNVFDVAFDAKDPQRVWIVGGDDRMIALSTDGGRTFTGRMTFLPHLRFIRVAVAPSDPKSVYLFGFNGTKVPLVTAVSADGGETWSVDDNASAGVATSNQIVEFLGVSPDDPQTVYVMVTSSKGDEIWKSTQRGRALTKILTLADQEEWPRGGFSFGASGQTLYVAGYDPLSSGTRPPASLYVSHDAGATWDRRPSPEAGPRFRCISYREGKLYGCAGEQFSGDQFLLGVSSDEGRSWTPVIRQNDVRGPHACNAPRCSNTVDFLQSFVDGGVPPVRRDAGATLPEPPAPTPPEDDGCSFGAGAVGAGAPVAAAVALLAGLVARLGARRRRRGRG
jgi:photosystem II stability/assembly factor-like uncharacterized protein